MADRPPRTDYFREREAWERRNPSIADSAAISLSTLVSIADSKAVRASSMASSVSINTSIGNSIAVQASSMASSNSINVSTAWTMAASASTRASSVSVNLSTAASSLSLITSTADSKGVLASSALSSHIIDTDPHTQYSLYDVITYGANGNIATTSLQGQVGKITGAFTLNLPTAVADYHGSFFASTAAVFSIDVLTATDIIILDGVALAAGHKITSDGTLGAKVFIECTEAGYYRATSILGVFADGGV